MDTIVIQKPTVITSRILINLIFDQWINIIIKDIFEILDIKDKNKRNSLKKNIKQNYIFKNEIYKQFKKFLIKK